MHNQNRRYLPSYECMFCKKSITETGGRRIIAKKILSIGLSNRYLGGGDKDYPYTSIKIQDKQYAIFKGPKEEWTDEVKEFVINEFKSNRHPWFCQKCGGRVCQECGAPVQYIHGCDIIYENGCSTHSAILPVPPGCINPECKHHRK